MTLSALAEPFDSHVPVDQEREVANQLRTLIAQSISPETGEAHLRLNDREQGPLDLILPRVMSETILNLLRMMSRGEAVSLVPRSEMLTTQRAADMLNVSRPYLIKLLDEEAIPYSKVGRHRRIRAQDLFAFVAARTAQRDDGLRELARMNEDMA